MKVKITVALTLVLSAILLLFCIFSICTADSLNSGSVSTSDIGTFEDWVAIDELSVAYKTDSFLLDKGESKKISFEIEQPGNYIIAMKYRPQKNVVTESTVTVEYLQDVFQSSVNSVWQLDSLEYAQDRYGNDVVMDQKNYDGYATDFLRNVRSLSAMPVEMYFEKGENSLTLTSDTVAIDVESIYVISTSDGTEGYENRIADGKDFIVIEAEQYAAKSDSYISSTNVQNVSFTPYDLLESRINCVGSFNEIGQKVQYNFTVENAGVYYITLHYKQDGKENMDVYRNIWIDGKPYTEALNSYAFGYTGLKLANETLNIDGVNLGFYLEAGEHTLTMEVDATPLDEYGKRMEAVTENLMDLGIKLNKLAAQSTSSNRTWQIEQYLPGITEMLENIQGEIDQIYLELSQMYTDNPPDLVNLQMASKLIRNALKRPDKLPLNTSLISEGSGSAAELLSSAKLSLESQGMTMDKIYIHGADADLPMANASFAKSVQVGIVQFYNSLTGQIDQYASYNTEGEAIDIWVNRSVQYVEMMQIMADSVFTPQTGIEVNFSIMPSEQKLVLSNASGDSPDGAMNVGQSTPFDMGLRGALADFTQFEDYKDFVKDELYIQAQKPYVVEDKVYGISETMDVTVMFYRTDIFESLGLEAPSTWQDVIDIMPILLSNNMNIYLPLSNTGTKSIGAMAPFIYQVGGELYEENGIYTAINSEKTIEAFELMTSLYSLYSVEVGIASFYNSFRDGTIPIGIAGLSHFLMLQNAAPEITDKWTVTVVPGIEQENGEVRRYMSAGCNSCIILKDSDKQEKVWEFYKWWLSEDIQNTYNMLLQTNYGPEYLWTSANKSTVSALPFSDEMKDIIEEQREWIKEVDRHPALYATERELSNAFLAVVNNGESARIAIDNAIVAIDRENVRKMDEYGYIVDGVVVKEFRNKSIEDIIGE